MSLNLTKPRIYGSDRDQLAQLRRYLFTLVDELQLALDAADSKEASATAAAGGVGSPAGTPARPALADVVCGYGEANGCAWHIWQSGRAELYATFRVTPEDPLQEYGVELPFPVMDAVIVGGASDGASLSPLRIRGRTVSVRIMTPDGAIGTEIQVHLMISGRITQKGE